MMPFFDEAWNLIIKEHPEGSDDEHYRMGDGTASGPWANPDICYMGGCDAPATTTAMRPIGGVLQPVPSCAHCATSIGPGDMVGDKFREDNR